MKRRTNPTSIVTERRWPAATVHMAIAREEIVRRVEIVVDAVDVPAAVGVIVDAAAAVAAAVVVDEIADAADRAGDDTRTFCHGFALIHTNSKTGHGESRGFFILQSIPEGSKENGWRYIKF